ncbi:MAG: GAF domain-containing protein [Acholeplasmatales bacterium]|jgi:GAF domain-containing protein|nr:GAF domain-containing protein [Acholeplasmatales bacterium]
MENINYDFIISEIKEVCKISKDKIDCITNMANISAILNEHLKNINWVGFYIFYNNHLVLGPFQGKVACTNIALDKGVCGKSFFSNKTLNVPNVHAFSDHIACDNNSLSELVIPFHANFIEGVLDIDSFLLNNFSLEDQKNIEEIVKTISSIL